MSLTAAKDLLRSVIEENGRVTVLTGAGVSAESGIPTFRGPEGFWTVGSAVYHPQEMATFRMFSADPVPVWDWYLYRLGLCQKALPNAGHRALAAMETDLGDRFYLITQNVDNLHIRAGNSRDRTLEIHGNIFKVRCASGCSDELRPMPPDVFPKAKGESLTAGERRQLQCPLCGGWLRPHVLWFDETYNERFYRFDSAIQIANTTRLLITVGTAGATTLPNHIVNIVYGNGGLMIDINVTDNPFADMALKANQGIFVQSPSTKALASLADVAAEIK